MEISVQHEKQKTKDDALEMEKKELLDSVKVSFNKIRINEGFLECRGDVTILGRGGANFMSKACKAKIVGTTEKGPKVLNLFLKHQTQYKGLDIFRADDIYQRELFMYREFSDAINELQAESNVPESERFKLIKCHDDNAKTIILDDLSPEDFRVLDRFDVVSLECAERVTETLARFHSLSFVLREKRPNFFAKHIQTMKQITQYNEDWEKLVVKLADITYKSLASEEKRERVAKFIKTITAKLNEYSKASLSGVSVLCHGDYRLANILVREKDGRISDLIPIDYQIPYYGCPATDLVYFIYGATDRPFRAQHLSHLQGRYHAAMRRFLGHFSLDADELYPMEAFQQDYEDRKDYGLITAINFLPFLLASDTYSPDYAQNLTEWSMDLNREVFDKRLNEIVDEFIENGDI